MLSSTSPSPLGEDGSHTRTSESVKTRILVISDTHSAPLLPKEDETPDRPFREPLPAADVLIHCGDLTMVGSMPEYHKALDALSKIDAQLKLVIAGNHDLTLDKEWMRTPNHEQRSYRSWEEAKPDYEKSTKLWKDPDGRAVKEGVTFLDEGVHSFVLQNGARLRVYTSPYTPESYDWGFAYAHDEDRFNTRQFSFADAKNIAEKPIPSFEDEDRIDIMITHGPPYLRLDPTAHGNVGCKHLLKALTRARPLVHCFGHIHEGWGAERVKWSDPVQECARSSVSSDKFVHGSDGFVKAINGVKEIVVSDQDAEHKHHVYYDASNSGIPLQKGRESLLINAAIMDVEYTPRNAPWLVDLQLPKAS